MPDKRMSRTEPNPRAERDLLDRLVPDIDANLLEFLRTQVDSFIKWDLIQFFYRNPNTVDTAENIASYIGRSVENMDQEMAELSSGGVLAASQLDGMTVYSLANDPEVRDLLRSFAESCDDRQFKLKAIYHILRNMR